MKTKHIAIGGLVAVGGFVGLRKYMQTHLQNKILERYQQNPILAGTALYSAAFGRPGKASRGGITKAAEIIATQMIPILGVSRPSEDEVIAYIQAKAIANARTNPQGLMDLGLEKARDLADLAFAPLAL